MGAIKHLLENTAEKHCICDGTISLDPRDHDDDCPVHTLLKEEDLASYLEKFKERDTC